MREAQTPDVQLHIGESRGYNARFRVHAVRARNEEFLPILIRGGG